MATEQARGSTGSLLSAGLGGTSGGMDGKVAKLETLMDVVRTDVGMLKADVRDVRDRLIRLEEKVAHLPTQGWAVGAIATLLGLMAALVTLAPRLQVFFGTAIPTAKTGIGLP